MSKPFTLIAALVLLAVAAAHAYRLYAHLSIVVGGHDIPLWVSWPGAAVAALFILRRSLIFGEFLADLLLRRRLRARRSGGRRAERKRRAREHHAARDAFPIVPAAVHDRLQSG